MIKPYKSLRCCICYEHKELIKCSQCTAVICYECYFQLRSYKCPQCKVYFYYSIEEGDKILPLDINIYEILFFEQQ